MNVPITRPTAHSTASAPSFGCQGMEEGVPQAKMNGVTTSPAIAFGTHHSSIVEESVLKSTLSS